MDFPALSNSPLGSPSHFCPALLKLCTMNLRNFLLLVGFPVNRLPPASVMFHVEHDTGESIPSPFEP